LQDYLDRSRDANVPWSRAQVFSTRIRRNIKLAECPSFGKSIFAYAPGCHGAQDYQDLAREVLGQTQIFAARVRIDETGQADVVSAQTSLDHPARAV
jgi:hypothetical protein